MDLSQVSIVFMLLCFSITFTASSNNPTNFTGDVSINCGSTDTSAAGNGRQWFGDAQSKLSSLLQLKGLSAISTVIHEVTYADPVPHKTARASRSQFSYSFQVNPGEKIIRLHFNPTTYRGFKGLKDLFTVEAGHFTLLSNFSASLTADALGVNTFAKEFCLNIQENQQFNIVFSPETSQTLGTYTYAFINGIEIIPVPANLSYFDGGEIGLQLVGGKSLVYVDTSAALEIVHRLNIKRELVPPTGDFDDMFPKWAKQKPDKIKTSTWKMPVEVGFGYLIRLHFSELQLRIARAGDLIFNVLINNKSAYTNNDILKAKDGNILLCRDYMVMMRGLKKDGKRDLLICLHSYDELTDGHGVLAGFEIVKLSNPDNSLAGPNPLLPPQDSPPRTIRILLSVLGHRNATATVAITIISLLSIIVHKFREIWEARRTEEEPKPSARAKQLCRRFSLSEIQKATRNFSDGLLIGRGGFGKVYKGFIDKGQKAVAVKRLKPNSQQGAREFLAEVETLSELRHVNLVSLIGYCSERREMILVYEYMARGTLADRLYKLGRDSSNYSSLTWKKRLDICIGAGRGLDYLHTGYGVIHRDIKASNILLDQNFTAKVSDFGLAKLEDKSKLQSHVSTKVKGTRGYLDAYYINTSKLTNKSDIYAFGVVMLEVLCGRPALDFEVSEDERLLSQWARDKISKGEVAQIVASYLREEISPNSLKIFIGVAERCLDDEPKNRPTMAQVVLQLQLALEQQDSKQPLVLNEISSASDQIEQSLRTGQPTMASVDIQNLTSPSKEKSNIKLVNYERLSERQVGTQAVMHKQSRLWPKKNKLLLSEIRAENVNLGKFDWDKIVAATNHFSSSNEVGHICAVCQPARMATSEYKLRTIQWKESKTQLRLLTCFHSTRNIPSLINLMEASRGTGNTLRVYAMHMMELSERSSAILMAHKARKNGMPFWNRKQDSDPNQIIVAFEAFQHLSQVSVRPITAISSMSSMHVDIYNSAAKKKVALIILPFHKHQRLDGRLETTRADFRHVNRRVLEHAPCSVGIFIDRGLGGTSHVAASNVAYNITTFFFGGRDDHEALSYGALMAEHPGISLNVVRFIVDPRITGNASQLHVDDQYRPESGSSDEAFLAEFKEKVSKNGSIRFKEIVVSNAAETVEAMRTYERCNLFVIGRTPEGELVTALNDKNDCPELGPVCNLLISPEFSTTTSVLVVQQYRSQLTGDSLSSLKAEVTPEEESDSQ